MKKLFKILIVPVFIIAPTMTVIACGTTSQQVSNQDILNSASGRMQNHTFNMTELSLSGIPNNDLRYEQLSGTARGKIESYYRELVKAGSITWDYPTVAVQIKSDNTTLFVNKYGPNVEARVNIIAHLSYQSLVSDKPITVRIANDNAAEQDKADAIKTYLKDVELNPNNPIFLFRTLLQDGLKSNAQGINIIYDKITSDLRSYLFETTSNENPFPIIDVAATNITVFGNTSSSDEIYTFDNQSLNPATATVTGKLKKLTLRINYNNKYSDLKLDDLTSQSLNVAQTFTDVNNQLLTTLNQAYNFKKSDLNNNTLPASGQTLAEYDPTPGANTFTGKIKTALFNKIAIIYPTAKMDSTWTADLINIPNPAASRFTLLPGNTHYGSFILTSVIFEFKLNNEVIIQATINNIQLNLNDL